MIRRKNALFVHFHGNLVKLKIFHAQFCTHMHIFFFNNKKIYQKQKQKKYFQKNYFQKKSSAGVLGSDVLG